MTAELGWRQNLSASQSCRQLEWEGWGWHSQLEIRQWMNRVKSQCQFTSRASWDSMGWNHVCDSVKGAAPCGSRRIRNHVQDRSEVFPPDDPTAMGADAGLLCICALCVLTLLINPETSLESGECPGLLSPTRLPQVCAQHVHRMAGNHHTPFTAAHLHRRNDPSKKH